VAHHKAIDHVRARRRQAVPVAEVPEQATAAPAPAERDQELWVRVRELPSKQRAAIALRFVADAPYAEISSVMGTSEEAARRNVHEGLKRLRLEYQP
jgi:RNA polymerase sigma factor (sigma-70 family)